MRKKKKLMQVDIIKGNRKITYNVDPTCNITIYEDGSIFVNEMSTVKQSLELTKNEIFPAESRSEFPPDCGFKFSDDPVNDNNTTETK